MRHEDGIKSPLFPLFPRGKLRFVAGARKHRASLFKGGERSFLPGKDCLRGSAMQSRKPPLRQDFVSACMILRLSFNFTFHLLQKLVTRSTRNQITRQQSFHSSRFTFHVKGYSAFLTRNSVGTPCPNVSGSYISSTCSGMT